MRKKSFEKKLQIKEYAEKYALSHQGKTPTVVSISCAIGLASSSVHRYLREMDEEGMIVYEHGHIRTDTIDKINGSLTSVALTDRGISCGTPEEVEASIEEYVSFPTSLLGEHGEIYTMRAMGDSMINAGIEPGDIVFIKRTPEARSGQIVNAMIDGRNTLKRLIIEHGEHYLWAENESWTDEDRRIPGIPEIQGVAIRILKKL